jgi:hypothetical protein
MAVMASCWFGGWGVEGGEVGLDFALYYVRKLARSKDALASIFAISATCTSRFRFITDEVGNRITLSVTIAI